MTEKYYKTFYNSPVGKLIIVCDNKENITELCLLKQNTDTENLSEVNDLEIFRRTKDWLNRYFRGENPEKKELPLKPKGSDFRQEVWKILCDIPYGKTVSYGEIAKIIAKKQKKEKMSAQAVGGAIAHNPIMIIIPCHRVIGKNGYLTGFSAGIETKIKLLQTEGVKINGMFVS